MNVMIGRGARVPQPCAISVAIALAFCNGAFADEVPGYQRADDTRLEQLVQQVERQERLLSEQQARIDAQSEQLRQTRAELEQVLARQRADARMLQLRGAGAAGAGSGQEDTGAGDSGTGDSGAGDSGAGDSGAAGDAGTAPASTAAQATDAPTANETAGQAPESASRPPPVAPLEDVQSALTPRGKWVLEPSLEFATATNDRVALIGLTLPPAVTIGLIDVRKVSREFFLAALSARYGLTSRMELEVKLPYVYRSDSTTARPLANQSATDSVFDNSGSGLGDIELGMRYQLNVGSATRPFYIASLRLKSTTGTGPFEVETYNPLAGATLQRELPTGTGFWALQPGITALLASDPAVFFGTLSYTWNIADDVDERDVSGNRVGRYDPGDAFNFNFGIGLALNERSSFSVGYDHSVVFKDKLEGDTVPLSQRFHVGRLLFGYSYQLTRRANFNLTLGAGITDDAPDVTLTARLPIVF